MDFGLIIERLRDLGRDLLILTPQLVLALVILVVTWLVARFMAGTFAKAIAHSKMRRSLKELVRKLIAALMWVVGIIAAATVAFPGITPGKLFTVLGVSSVAIGFAFKEIFENFMAGTVILFRDVIEIGDVIKHGETTGRVEKITIRDTHLRTLDGRRIILPNACLFRESVAVLTDQSHRRQSVVCGVSYGCNLSDAQVAMERALKAAESVSKDREMRVLASKFGASSVDFDLIWWCDSSPMAMRLSRNEVLMQVFKELADNNIEIPFPQRVLHLADKADDVVEMLNSQADPNGGLDRGD